MGGCKNLCVFCADAVASKFWDEWMENVFVFRKRRFASKVWGVWGWMLKFVCVL